MRIEIYHKHMKHVRLRVEEGIVKISAPEHMSYEEIMQLVEERESTILSMIEREAKKDKLPRLFGEEIIDDHIVTPEDVEELYRRELPPVLDEIFRKWNEKTGIYEKEYRIRKMKRRWGTCYYERGLIVINLNVAALSREEVEAVVLHELMHLRIPHHNQDFYCNMEVYLPNYREIDRRLKR